ncbi:cytochrome b/b6 domain-containing protein [Corynebacterium epidermidicanis]|uniref:Thiosulfate reductase cytochrome B subunit (Membrane anchoring protein) n=1 Tax=Corynebacterium epidermidicanis TaxID=1050174 RepID=A0A0G3GT15_9CORY|nr:cytochrome b/b6 domain-containing protein [Corynebacterium epidermidicanis]AKK02663.1 thiosulfate reductase cytochrome B subunit (membrane anchoring protein) [Corynebacterium epidermidicanis]
MTTQTLRRGLPRVPGGDGWPPAGVEVRVPAQSQKAPPAAATAAPAPVTTSAPTVTREISLRQGLPRVPGGAAWPETAVALLTSSEPAPQVTEAPEVQTNPAPADTALTEVALRQGLPRTPGGAPWPEVTHAQVAVPVTAELDKQPPVVEPPQEATAPPASQVSTRQPQRVEKQAEPRPAWVGKAAGIGLAALVVLVALVLGSRWLVDGPAHDFITRYPGVAPTPQNTPVGLPAWLGWSHFFNFFLMALIIRSGIQIRRERKPEAYFTSKSGKKVSLTIWFHTSMDLLWLLNGVIFVVLLFATGQWKRIVPTSWEVFPNMASAALQYLSLNWPAENGWIHYNALQQVAYFVTVFIAAPIAAATGFRMSNWWPTTWKFFPVEIARKLHFPTMLYFVLFIISHVFLVFATGFKKNLGHMFAATPDGGWLGVGLFVLALAVTVGAVWAARPMLLAPIARAFGKVTNR